MRIIPFAISTVITAALVFSLSKKWGSAPRMGSFLSPQQGFWQNAEPTDLVLNEDLKAADLKGKADIFFDERLVPHVFTENDEDACFITGYLHAKYRLWQLEFQTLATAGRVSEVIGARAINFDKEQRRMGMVYAAENAVKAMEANETTRSAVQSYTAGVNYYIDHLTEAELPIEYKILDYKPERWNTLKTALFIKQLTKTLAGYSYSNDLQYTNLRSLFSDSELKVLFPYSPDSLSPIMPTGTLYTQEVSNPLPPPLSDSVYLQQKDTTQLQIKADPRNPGIGSNNWAVSGSKTQSGAPILCNDPHLDLTLPSIWYEIQLSSPTHNVYGVTLPGIPGIVIGFNDNIAFGLTNGGIDVMDFYDIRFKDDSKKQYWYNNNWTESKIKIEQIRVRGQADILDTVAYTVFGPVMYDKSFSSSASNGKAIAIRWKAHDPSNELLMWWNLNRAKNYDDYLNALQFLECPVQNVIYASKQGDIAIWQQGKVPLRWPRQGVYLMPGEDSAYLWKGYIPQPDNPHTLNPARGFVSSANQRATDSTYPYYIPGDFAVYRGWRINHQLESMSNITPTDMMKLQNDNYNSMAEMAKPALIKYLDISKLSSIEKKLYDIFINWNLENTNEQKGATIFHVWMDSLSKSVWSDEFAKAKDVFLPDKSTLVDHLIGDSIFIYADNINTPEKESITDIVTQSFHLAAKPLSELDRTNTLNWGSYNSFTFFHLLRNSVMPFARANISSGGGAEIINALRNTSGPSWRMVVQLSSKTEAFGVYPGGQSGNPGSPYYESFINTWAKGDYYPLWMMDKSESNSDRIIGKIHFSKG